MNQITRDTRSEKGFDDIWESWRYLFKSDLEKLDYRSRQMMSEMKLEGVKNPYIAEYLPIVFKQLTDEVLREQNALDRKERKRA